MTIYTLLTGNEKNKQPMINHHFSYVHASFWLGIEQCSIRRRFLVPDESGPIWV